MHSGSNFQRNFWTHDQVLEEFFRRICLQFLHPERHAGDVNRDITEDFFGGMKTSRAIIVKILKLCYLEAWNKPL